MDFLNNLALPQSHEHLILLKYLLGLTFTLFVPYLSILIGASFFSVILKKKAAKEGDQKYIRLARDIVNIATLNRSVVFALGIVPLISAIFCYIQILQNSSASVVTILTIALVTFSAGLILFFSYKNSFNLKSILNYFENKNVSVDDKSTKETIDSYNSEISRKYKNADIWSFILFIITALFFISSVELASNSQVWGKEYSVISTIFSLGTISYLLYLFGVSIVLTSVTALFFYYRVKNTEEYDSEYIGFVRSYSVTTGLVYAIILPVFVLINLLFTPEIALSSYAFVAIVLLLGAILLLSSFLYVMQKDGSVNYVSTLLVLVILFFVLTNAKDQLAFSAASKQHLASLEADFKKYEEDFKASLGISTVVISGEDIYNGKCIACHQFDQKLVGPPYKDVLPKYVENKEGLVDFILNPVKIDDSYPAMPNQGLKPNEAKAVAEYLLETYKQ